MSIQLIQNSYGKGRVRLKKLIKHDYHHEVKEVSVQVICEGDFEAAHRSGDNTTVLPTDTQKNTIYALAKNHSLDTIEEFGLDLANHFLSNNDQFSRVTVNLEQTLWDKIPIDGSGHPHAVQRRGNGQWTSRIRRSRAGVYVQSGLKRMNILKTTLSGFSNFKHDDYTTLKDIDDRMLETNLTAKWVYSNLDPDFKLSRTRIQETLLKTFANHDSLSVQHTLYAMGKHVLETCPEVEAISINMPNKHNLLYDLSKFNMENNNEIFVVTDEPYGIIRGTMRRDG